MPCKPFEHLEQVHPFRALVTSILGQQISWLAARSINHRFVRLYDSSLPEKPTDYEALKSSTSFFPSPEQVSKTDVATLRSAGLSTRKAEYVQDLASRFADGRLSTQKLVNADDEKLAQMLIEVRGIGRWTVDMFAIFSLRRPDILPVGDLGIQRGLVRWFLSLHSPSHSYSISPQKVGGQSTTKKTTKKGPKGKEETVTLTLSNDDELPTFENSLKQTHAPPTEVLDIPLPLISFDLPVISEDSGGVTIPPAFTPSIKKTLDKPAVDAGSQPVPLPPGIDVGLLKSRLDGKKKIKGAFLTPKEMEDLTECWKPYRSLGVYYMWSLADVAE
ncbi:DNA glycosylase [Collybia nuda]|uniref:DNA glycosylase n=1 Tax=Collybia nuda TaxID=64659 RepID=A0A9P5Y231_9AGAR|nr:DNA glycosylase [Collybia nuda]